MGRPWSGVSPAVTLAGTFLLATGCGTTGGTTSLETAAPATTSRPAAATITSPTTSTTTSSPSTSSSTTTSSSTSTTTSSPTTTSTTITSTTVPRADVRRIASGGDSLMLGVIPPLQTALEHSGYDFAATWFLGFLEPNATARWKEILDTDADVLVVLFGPWESASLEIALVLDGDDPGWIDRYRTEQVEPRLAALAAGDTELIFVTAPTVDDPGDTARRRAIAEVWRDVIDGYDTMTWIDGDVGLTDHDGDHRVIDSTVLPPVRLFMDDGRHLCPGGGRRVADQVIDLLTARYGVIVDETWQDTGWEDNPEAYDVGKC